jgi:serine/threonine-protein kinase
MNERELFVAALQRENASKRAAFLDEACGGNADLREQVEALLLEHEQLGSFLESPAVAVPDTVDQAIMERPGTVIGPYKLLEQIGEGGFGVVFMAEQQEPIRRKVALKVLKPGMDSKQVIARFEAERQALALMDHPNIAKVLDAGQTTHGRPFFVMDLVRGLPITEYCDQSQLRPRDRLELFECVCQAVQHAHQKGIIHRDLKPSNVLVTKHDATPVVKVIDFGVAKAMGQQLTDKTLFTGFAQMVGTPLYMSPEQAGWSGLDVDTRSDIYSLGVLLYELLTGTTPFDKERLKEAGYEEMRRIIREEEPPKPSTRISTLGQASTAMSAQRRSDPKRLSQLVRGELDWIVMKALEKDPNRRYETASAFAADVQRYLADEPVQACPPSAVYRLRKFARRNKRALVTAALIAVVALVAVGSLAGGLGWRLREQAERRTRTTETALAALKDSEEFQRQAQIPEALEAGRRAQAAMATGEGSPDLHQRVRERVRDLQMAADLEQVRAKEGDAFDFAQADQEFAGAFQRYGIDVENLDPAEASARIRERSVAVELAAALDYWALRRRAVAGEGKAEKWQRLIQVARLADPDDRRQRVRDALLERDEETLKKLAADPKTLELRASTLELLGNALRAVAGPRTALTVMRAAQLRYPGDFWINYSLALCFADIPQRGEALQFYRLAVGLRPSSPVAWIHLGAALYERGATDDAIAALRESLRLNPDDAAAYSNLGNALAHQGDYDGALAAFEKAIELGPNFAVPHLNLGKLRIEMGDYDRAITECQHAIRLQPYLIEAHNNLGLALLRKGAHEQAVQAYRKAIDLAEKRMRRVPRYRVQLARGLGNLAQVYGELARPEAEQTLRRALELWHQLEKDDPLLPEWRVGLGMNYNNLGILLRRQGRRAQAEKALWEAVRYHALAVENSTAPDRRFFLAGSYIGLGNLFAAEGRQAEAEKVLDQAAQLLRPLAKDYPAVIVFKVGLANTHFNRGSLLEIPRPADAEKEYRQAVKLFGELAEKHPDAPEYRERLATSYNRLGRVLTVEGSSADAEHALREARKHLEPLVDQYPRVPAYRKSLAVNYNNLACLLHEVPRRAAEEEQLCIKCLKLYEQLDRDYPSVPEYQSGLAGALHNRAIDLRKRKNLTEARQHMERAIKLQRTALEAVSGRHPRYREGLRNHFWGLAEIHLEARDHAAAAKAAENLPRVFPDRWEECDLAASLLASCAELSVKDDRLPEAERRKVYSAYVGRIKELLAEATKRIAAAQPQTADTRQALAAGAVKIGNIYSDMLDAAMARKCYLKAIELDPTLAVAHFKLGCVLHHLRLLTEADASLGEAIKLRPDYAEAHEIRAWVLKDQGKIEDAVAAYRTACKHYTDKTEAARAYVNLGTLLAEHGRLPEAEETYRQAIKLHPKNADGHSNLGLALGQQGKTREAMESFRAAIAIKPDYSAAWGNLGFDLQREGEFAEALKAFEKSRDLLRPDDPGRPRMQQYVDWCARLVDLNRKLAKVLNGTVRPEDAGKLVELAQVCAAKKLYGAAARFYKEASAEGPPPSHRYDAACAAALAAAGQGKDNPPLDEKERARWRKQALDWLKTDLEVWSQQVHKGPAAGRAAAVQKLARWQHDVALADLRGVAIGELPKTEREAWRQLWTEVETLLARLKLPPKEGSPKKP